MKKKNLLSYVVAMLIIKFLILRIGLNKSVENDIDCLSIDLGIAKISLAFILQDENQEGLFILGII